MPIDDISLESDTGRDLHLLRGGGLPPLLRRGAVAVHVVGAPVRTWLSDYTDTDLAVEFRPTFRYSNNTTEYFGFGIRVNHRTGEVTTDPPPVAGTERVDNFLIEIVVRRNDGGRSPKEFDPLTVRVHLHDSVQAFWLTPSRMTVRRRTPAAAPEQTAFRFTARAEFNDGTVGDVTLHHGVRWSPPALFAPQPAAPNLLEAALFGRVLVPTGLGPPTGTVVTATLPAAWGGAAATATFTVRPPWSEPGEAPRAELFKPASAPGGLATEQIPNILFVSSGYKAGDLPDFETHTANLLHRMHIDPMSKPFDILARSMNFWRVAVPSEERGVCVRREVFLIDGPPKAQTILTQVRPSEDVELEPGHLLYLAGLPRPSDLNVPLEDLRDRWAKTWPNAFGLLPDDPWPTGRFLDPLDATKLPDLSIERWRLFARRTFVDEVDTALPLSVGAPNLSSVHSQVITLHPDRGGVEALDDFLAALQAANGLTLDVPIPNTPIGALWGTDQTRHRFDNRGLVTMLCGTELGRMNAIGSIMMSLNASAWGDVVAVAGRNAVRELQPIAPVVSANLGRVFVHELAHRFGLGDEYVEYAAAFTGDEAEFDGYGNVTSLPAVRPSDHFRSDLIKWNWERIRAAGVLAVPLGGAGPIFTASLLAGHAKAFKKDDEVRLRLRRAKAPLTRLADLGPVFEVTGIAGDTLTLRQKTAGAFNPASFVMGSVVYAPVKAPAGVTYPYARMIAPVIERQMDSGNRPLTKWPREVPELYKEFLALSEANVPQLPVTITFGGFFATWSHRLDARIVGLYENGGLYAKNTFHPTGACKMRQGRAAYWPFCPVCRYVLVDFIDPSAHGAIDAEYAEQYPPER